MSLERLSPLWVAPLLGFGSWTERVLSTKPAVTLLLTVDVTGPAVLSA